MIHAYDGLYVECARRVMACMLDFAVHDLGYNLNQFYDMFLKTEYGRRFGEGDPSIVAGKSGVELTYDVIFQYKGIWVDQKPEFVMERRPEYWVGWALAYYQWESGISFEQIQQYVDIEDILYLYPIFHEMDIRHFVEEMNRRIRLKKYATNLKQKRILVGLSQKELSEFSGVPLRTLQQYEQRQKDINKAQVGYLISLAQVLCCKITDLTE